MTNSIKSLKRREWIEDIAERTRTPIGTVEEVFDSLMAVLGERALSYNKAEFGNLGWLKITHGENGSAVGKISFSRN